MSASWIGHTVFSRDATSLDEEQINFALANGHTHYSLGFDNTSDVHNQKKLHRDPAFVTSFSGKIKEMDDRHAELYMFGDHSADFNVDRRGTDTRNWVCPWQPSPASRVDGFVKFATLNKRDVVVDFGCGDGRVLIQAALSVPGLRGIGLDISEECVSCAVEMAKAENVDERISFVAADFCIPQHLSPGNIPLLPHATVAYVYLVPKALKLVRPLLRRLADSGVRIFTHEYHYEDWEPQEKDAEHDLRMMTSSVTSSS